MSPAMLEKSEKMHACALRLLAEYSIIETWENAGAEVRPVGSFAMDLMMKHRDIDLHIYTETLDVTESMKIIGRVMAGSGMRKLVFINGADTDEHCFEWHVWCAGESGDEWQLDMIQILKGSAYDGYFEHVADRIKSVMTPEMKLAILSLKNDTPDDVNISGIEYYRAVIEGGARSYRELLEWREKHPACGIMKWCP